MDAIKKQLSKYKKYVIAFALVGALSAYLLWPDTTAVQPDTRSELDVMLDNLESGPSQVAGSSSVGVSRPEFQAIDQNNIHVSGGGSIPDASVFDASLVRIDGIFAGYGSKTQAGETYDVVYLEAIGASEVNTLPGYILDLREFVKEGNGLPQFVIGDQIMAFGTPLNKTTISVVSFGQAK